MLSTKAMVIRAHMGYNPTCGSQLGQSDEPEVGGIWPKVGGRHFPFYCYFNEYNQRKCYSNVPRMSYSLTLILHIRRSQKYNHKTGPTDTTTY